LDHAAQLYHTIVDLQVFTGSQLPQDTRNRLGLPTHNAGLAGFDTVQPSSGLSGRHTADGHSRLAWFLMNYVLIRNGYEPFYFDSFGDFDTDGEYQAAQRDALTRAGQPDVLRRLLEERVRPSGAPNPGGLSTA